MAVKAWVRMVRAFHPSIEHEVFSHLGPGQNRCSPALHGMPPSCVFNCQCLSVASAKTDPRISASLQDGGHYRRELASGLDA